MNREAAMARIAFLLGLNAVVLAGLPGLRAEPAALPLPLATVPSGFTDSTIVTGLQNPISMAFAPDGRLFVCEKGGRLRVVKNGSLLATPFVTINVGAETSYRGLLSVAFDPNFASNQFVYVQYSVPGGTTHNRVSRFTANGDVAVAGSEFALIDLDTLVIADNHNGGPIRFGGDGKLYVCTGDDGLGSISQSLNNLLGKVLRLNPDGTIPTDNPFYATATGKYRAIWATGLRNPFCLAVQPGTGRIFIGDVGGDVQSSWEEINDGIAGANYGWADTEGATTDPRFRSPVHAYPHNTIVNGRYAGCITGGAFYNPAAATFPASYVGKYFFADHIFGWIKVIDPASPSAATTFATAVSKPVDVKLGPDGALYYLSYDGTNGALGKIQYSTGTPPAITLQPVNRTVPVGQTATFTVSASGSAPLGYQWQRNGTNITGATATSYTTPPAVLADNGAQFRCVVTNGFGMATSNAATLTVTSNTAPTAAITTPGVGTLYSAGDAIAYSGTGTDAEDGTLPASAFTWWAELHHGTHTHPFMAPASGATGGTLTIPTSGETSDDVWYRLHLRVTDSGGLTSETTRDILPRKVTLGLRTSPAGLQVTLDGIPRTSPTDVLAVVGLQRSLGAATFQTSGSTTYQFESWSDGGAQTRTITTPPVDTTYTATFQVVPPDPRDNDADGIPNDQDPDDDNDGIADPIDPDRDGDGATNADELAAGTDPDDRTSVPATASGDGGGGCGLLGLEALLLFLLFRRPRAAGS